ncbi:hypothetical protein B0H14DRAFT_2977194 [Mycena olivaceomarginata]|nr:hypothetical protein B0H14DRAFT_2977194 [Mycena olivaceomarginata]
MSLFGHVPASYVMSSPMRQVLGGGTRVVPAATSLHFHVASHVSHPHVAPCSVPPCASSAPSGTCPPSHYKLDIPPSTSTPHKNTIPAAISSRFHAASHILHPHVAPRHRLSCTSSALPPTLLTSHSNLDASPLPSTRRKNRSRRCFVCGGTGKHRLHPRFCPRTLELISNKLAMFNFDFRLVSFDGSPLPMTRHPGGVAARLLSPRGPSSHPARASPRSPSTSPGSSKLNPPHIRRVPCTPIANHLPSAIPIANLNRSHTSHSPVEPPVRISSPDHQTLKSNPPHVTAAAANCPRTIEPSVDSNPPHVSPPSAVHPRPIPHSDHSGVSSIPHFPPVERLRSPPIYLPVRLPFPDSKPPTDAASENSSPHIALNIFELLFVSPPIRNELRKLIDTMDRLNVGYEIPSCPSLRKVFYRILDQIMESLSSVR